MLIFEAKRLLSLKNRLVCPQKKFFTISSENTAFFKKLFNNSVSNLWNKMTSYRERNVTKYRSSDALPTPEFSFSANGGGLTLNPFCLRFSWREISLLDYLIMVGRCQLWSLTLSATPRVLLPGHRAVLSLILRKSFSRLVDWWLKVSDPFGFTFEKQLYTPDCHILFASCKKRFSYSFNIES